MTKKPQFNFRATEDFMERIRILAAIDGTTMSAFVLGAVTAAYEKRVVSDSGLRQIIDDARKVKP